LLKKVFYLHDITFWLEKGTAVGAARHGEFVPWDSDVDVSIFSRDMMYVSKTKYDFEESDFELYYMNGHYGVRNRETKEHIICILPHKKIKNKNYWIEYIPPLTYFINALELNDYDVPDINYIETTMKHIKLPRKCMELFAKISFRIVKRQTLITLIFKIQSIFHLYKKFFVSPAHHIEKLDTLQLYSVDFNVPSSIDSYLQLLFGDWKIPKHKGQVVTEWDGKALPKRY
jgi:phosphorylcholine metabolism protein LicD